MTPHPSPKGHQHAEGHSLQGGTADRLWHKSAPAALHKAAADGDPSLVWEAWRGHLVSRSAAREAVSAGASLHWGLPMEWRLGLTQALAVGGSAEGVEPHILGWLGEVAGEAPGVEYAAEAVAFARNLPDWAGRMSADVWFALLEHLLDAARDASALDAEQDPLCWQLLDGELPLTLACLLPELEPCRKLAEAARRVLSAGVSELLDGEGLLHGRHFALTRPLLACWVRCEALGKSMKRDSFSATDRRQLAAMTRHALRFARHGGDAMLGPKALEDDAHLLRAAAASLGTTKDRLLAAMASLRAGDKGPAKMPKLPPPATQSEWAATALLRTDWSPTSPRAAVVYAGQAVQLELGCGRDAILSGHWSLSVRRDGCELLPRSDWEQVCWVSDADMDYLELEMELDGGVRVQRQMALAHEDRFLFLADAVLGEQTGKLDYRACVPLAAGVVFKPAEESREGCLEGSKRRAMAFPLALPEWRSLCAAGELQATSAGLQWTHAATAPRLYAPVLLDLDRHRFSRPHTWRRLTVGESLAAQPDHVAVGYRVAIGRKQWLIYRSLAGVGNRTLLGHNLSTEALIARFDAQGEVEPLIEVE